MSSLDQQRTLKQFTNSQLLAILDGRSSKLSAQRAATAIFARNLPNRVEVAELILRKQEEPESRIAAIHNLGRIIDSEAQNLLEKNLRTLDIAEKNSTIWSLAKIGDVRALERLRQIDTGGDEKLEVSIRRAQRLIAFRNGVEGFEFDARRLPRVARLPDTDTQVIKVTRLTRERLDPYQQRLAAQLPGIKLSEKGAVQLNCLKKQLWLLKSAELEKRGWNKAVLKRPNIPMAIFGYAHCTNRPYLQGYVYAQPMRGGAKLFVTRSRGQTTHSGRLREKGNDLVFELSGLRTRYSPPARLSGRLGRTGSLKIEDAIVHSLTSSVAKLRQTPGLAPRLTGVNVPDDESKDNN